jgi:hypothetical protein
LRPAWAKEVCETHISKKKGRHGDCRPVIPGMARCIKREDSGPGEPAQNVSPVSKITRGEKG